MAEVGVICDLQVKNLTPNLLAIAGPHHPRGAAVPLTSVAWRWFFPFCLVLFLPNALVQNHLALPSMVCKQKVGLSL